MRRLIVLASLVAMVALSIQAANLPRAGAAVGGVLRTLNPSPSGNGRAIAHDPRTGRLFYTNSGDPQIHVIRADGSWVATLNPIGPYGPIVYGALSWQPTTSGGILWGGRFDGSGAVDKIDPITGVVTPAFQFAFPQGMSCYPQPAGLIDGLSWDPADGTLWLGDDNATEFYRVSTTGQILGRYAVPSGRCRTGIAADGNFLWLGLQSGPDTAPYDLARVDKNSTTSILQDFSFGNQDGPEGLVMDKSTFSPTCALWSNQFGLSTTLKAWQLPTSLCRPLPTVAPPPGPGLRSVGLLTFRVLDSNGLPVLEYGQPEVRGCVATVVDSENLSTIVTAGHCLASGGSFAGQHANLQFAPAHTGPCWANPSDPQHTPQVDVSRCGNNPYGVWLADASDIHLSPSYNPNGDTSDDYAFIVVRPAEGNSRSVQAAVGGFPITWDTATDPATDPLQQQLWLVASYASDDPNFTTRLGFGPFGCPWRASSSTHLGSSASRIGVEIGFLCAFVKPNGQGFNVIRYFALPDTGAPFGTSGSPFINNLNSPGRSYYTVGAILSGAGAYSVNGRVIPTLQGAKFGVDAQTLLETTQTLRP